MYRVLIIAIALILYGSLWPWQYNPAHASGNPLLILLHSWSTQTGPAGVEDIVVNLLLYIPVGMFGYLALDRHHHRRLRLVGPVLIGFVLSCSVEMLQIFDKTRNCSAVDVLCNTLSSAIGVLLGYVFRQSHLASLSRPAIGGRPHSSGPLVLIYIWVGFQTIPMFPLTLKILPKIHALWAVHFSVIDALASFTAWLIVARLLEATYDPKLGRLLVLPLSLLVPAKLCIANRTFTIAELAGLVASVIIWNALLARLASRTAILSGLTILMLILQGLRPFHFGAPIPFSWVPFQSLLSSPWEGALVILCQKSFWYGSAVWLLFSNLRRPLPATAIVAVLLAGIEIIQIRLPGRTADSTDPVLAILLGLILWFLEVHARRAKALLSDPELACATR